MLEAYASPDSSLLSVVDFGRVLHFSPRGSKTPVLLLVITLTNTVS
jgi:hypothetical protein